MPKFFYNIVLCGSVLLPCMLHSQNLSTEGDDFWLGFMENWLQNPDNPIILEIYISADDSTNVHLEMPHYNGSFTPLDTLILPDRSVKIIIPTHLGMATGTNQVQNRGIHITSDKDVSVYAMNKRQYSADMAVILPSYTLGNEYVVISHWEQGNRNNNNNSDSEFLILAIEDNTKIQIIPSHMTEGGNIAGVPFSITLNEGQVYQVQARGDLTGSRIDALANTDSECKKFAVFAGNQYTKVGECDHPNGHDHLYAQMYPTYTWGKEYITVDFNTRINGDHIKVIAAQDNSEIFLNGQYVNTLSAGEFLFLRELDGINYISSENPISVAQFSRSQACDGTVGDPFIILINPNEQVLKKITFYAPAIATIQNYNLSIVTKTTDVSTVRLDGNDISYRFSNVPFNPEYSYAKVSVGAGNHILRSVEGLIAYVYGYGYNESFGYPTGAGLTNLSLNFTVLDNEGEVLPIDSICHKTEIWFKPETEFEFTDYQWDFGDGTIITINGPDSISHTYDKPGKYIVELTASSGTSGCVSGAAQSSVKVVRVLNPQIKILGPRSVCPNTGEVPYYVNKINQYDNFWVVSGGSIVQDKNDTLIINWGDTNNDAFVKVRPMDNRGCIGDTITKMVKIKVQLDPEAPVGPDSLCSDNITDLNYQAFYIPGTTYNWMTDFGNINSGQGNNQIFMEWESYGYGKLWYEQISVTDTVCEGTSDTLIVYIQRKPSDFAEIITDTLIYGINESISFSILADSLYHLVSWQFQDNIFIDSVSINYNPVITYNCPGVYSVEAITIDTAGLCYSSAHPSIDISIIGPSIEIIQVSHEENIPNQLFINWKYEQNTEYNKPYYLIRDYSYIDTLSKSQLIYNDTAVTTDFTSYQYQMTTNEDCETIVSSSVHEHILLRIPEDRITENEATIEWNDYIGWSSGVDHYEIWMQVDSGEYSLLNEYASSTLEFRSEDLGFEHCFKVRASELNGNNAYSWSNIACVTFIPELYPYNIITPNDDGINDVFVIENIEHYPNAVLTVFNRWGRQIFKTRAYKNNWGGMSKGKILSNSTYYYVLELNEPRSEQKVVNGTISVFR